VGRPAGGPDHGSIITKEGIEGYKERHATIAAADINAIPDVGGRFGFQMKLPSVTTSSCHT